MKKRIFAVLLALSMVLHLLPVQSFAAALASSEASEKFGWGGTTEDGFEYEDGEFSITITGYVGNASEVVIPAKINGKPVGDIGSDAFYCNTNLTSVLIPDSVSQIGSYAFHGCENLTSVTLPREIRSIGTHAFSYCTNLSEIIFQRYAPYIGDWAFSGICATVYVPYDDPTWTTDVMKDYGGTLTWVGGCSEFFTHSDTGLIYWINEDHVGIVRYGGTATELDIPAEIEGLPVTKIGYGAFRDRVDLTHVTVPDSVTAIDAYAFYSCSNLRSVTLPDRLEEICECTFYDCIKLNEVTIPNGIASIGDEAFYNCDKLGIETLPDGVTSIGYYSFGGCDALCSMAIPDSVTSIGHGAFYGCNRLYSVSFGSGVASIGYGAFMYCNLTSVTFPASIRELDTQIFDGCYQLSEIIFKGDAPSFTSYTFHGVTATAYYPTDNATWTEDVLQDYGGSITWKARCLEHSLGEWIVEFPASCFDTGMERRSCTRCDYSETRIIESTGHNYQTVVHAPTCTEDGYTAHICSNCGDFFTDAYTDPLGHDMGEWTVTTAPTCTESGMEKRSCSRCDHSETREIEATGHSYEAVVTAPTCTEQGYTTYTCACGDSFVRDYVDALGHAYEDGVCIRCGEQQERPFSDVPGGAWYEEPVLWAVENSITNGISATEFGPNAECNRAQVVTFLWRAAGSPEPSTPENPFVDVQAGSFYEKAVLWAVEKGITTGTNATHFSPNAVCNRATVVTFLYRAAGSPAVENADNPFSDVPANSWYTAPVLWAVENGITNGISATEFGPNAGCNRAQIVTFLYRAYN